MSDRDAFYVGYHGKAPAPLARTNRIRILGYAVAGLLLAGVLSVLQGSPGEGRIIDGFVTCPWHGFQYRPDDGASPPIHNTPAPVSSTMPHPVCACRYPRATWATNSP